MTTNFPEGKLVFSSSMMAGIASDSGTVRPIVGASLPSSTAATMPSRDCGVTWAKIVRCRDESMLQIILSGVDDRAPYESGEQTDSCLCAWPSYRPTLCLAELFPDFSTTNSSEDGSCQADALDRPVFLPYTGRVSTVDYLPEDDRLELLQGTLEVLILRSLKLQPNHAYGISQFLQQQSDSEFLVDNGSLYPALQRLLQREWISAQWKTSPNGRRARYYSLTLAGRKQLVKATSKWQRFALAMARILAPEG